MSKKRSRNRGKRLRNIQDQEVLLERKEGGKEGKKGNNSIGPNEWFELYAACTMSNERFQVQNVD